MAIAYYIPDQAKLLAGRHRARDTANNIRSSTQQSSRLLQSTAPVSETANTNPAVNRGYGTSINISVPTYTTTPQEPLGCWDFLTQVFCHALRFYHESSQIQPTVIQISVNFNSNTPTAPTTSTVNTTTLDTTATTTPTASSAAENVQNDIQTNQMPIKSSKWKN